MNKKGRKSDRFKMDTRSKKGGRKAKGSKNSSLDPNYEEYEFLEDEEKDPYETDGTEDEYLPDNQKVKKQKQTKQPKQPNRKESTKKVEKKDQSLVLEKTPKRKKAGSTGNKEDKLRLAGIIKGEEVIYNLNHKWHSNLGAVSAAWDRVAMKMDKPGKNKIFLFTF